jgi:hypothetical protein
MTNELQKHEPLQAPATISGVNIEAILNKAIDAKSAVEVIKELRAMWKDDNEIRAKAEFDEAMSAFQSRCPVILKEKVVKTDSGQKAYAYAPIEAIEVQIRPLLREHGFSHTFDTDTESPNGWVIAKCIVTHRAGHSRISTGKFPIGTKTRVMSDTQVVSAALTFANRRALCNAYGLVLAGEDIDGATGKLKPEGPSALRANGATDKLRAELWEVLKPVRGNQQNWAAANQWLWDENVINDNEHAPQFTPERFAEVISKCKSKLR